MNLTQAQINEFIAQTKRYKYLVAAGETELNPLAGPPQIEGDITLSDTVLYETGSEVQDSIISGNRATITIDTRNVDEAMELLATFKKGDRVFDPAKKVALTLVPITDDLDAKTITFPAAFLQPGLSTSFGDGDDPDSVSLVYIAKEDETQTLFKYE